MIAVGSDHRGYRVRQRIMKFLKEQDYSYKDFGAPDEQPVDYPDVARLVGEEGQEGKLKREFCFVVPESAFVLRLIKSRVYGRLCATIRFAHSGRVSITMPIFCVCRVM